MSLKLKFFAAATSAVAVLAFSTFVAAQDTKPQTGDGQKSEKRECCGGRYGNRDGFGRGMRGGKRHGMRGGMRGFGQLNLTDAQKEQIRTIRQGSRPDQATMEQMRTLMKAQRDGTITPEQKEQLKSHREMQKTRMQQTHEQVLAVLTPEQRQQIETRKEEMRQRMQQRRQNKPAKTVPPVEKKDN